MKRTINESQLRQIVAESVKNILKERYTPNKYETKMKDDFTQENIPTNLLINLDDKFHKTFSALVMENPRLDKEAKQEICDAYYELMDKIRGWNGMIHDSIRPLFTQFSNPYNFRGPLFPNKANSTGEKCLNPLTGKFENMNEIQAAKIINKLFSMSNEELNMLPVEMYKSRNELGGYEADRAYSLDYIKENGYLNSLIELTTNAKPEPEDWYERNEHGDFDNEY